MYAINDWLNKTKKLLNENRTTVRILFMYFSFQMAKALFFAPDRLLLLWLKLWIVIDNHDNDNAYQLSNYHQHRCTREIHRKTHWCCWQHASSFSISTNDLLLLCWINAHLSKVCESEYQIKCKFFGVHHSHTYTPSRHTLALALVSQIRWFAKLKKMVIYRKSLGCVCLSIYIWNHKTFIAQIVTTISTENICTLVLRISNIHRTRYDVMFGYI